MAEIVWSEPALSDLDAIADYIALESPAAAAEFVKRIFGHVDQFTANALSGEDIKVISVPAAVRRSFPQDRVGGFRRA